MPGSLSFVSSQAGRFCSEADDRRDEDDHEDPPVALHEGAEIDHELGDPRHLGTGRIEQHRQLRDQVDDEQQTDRHAGEEQERGVDHRHQHLALQLLHRDEVVGLAFQDGAEGAADLARLREAAVELAEARRCLFQRGGKTAAITDLLAQDACHGLDPGELLAVLHDAQGWLELEPRVEQVAQLLGEHHDLGALQFDWLVGERLFDHRLALRVDLRQLVFLAVAWLRTVLGWLSIGLQRERDRLHPLPP